MTQVTLDQILGLDPTHLVDIEDKHRLLSEVADAYREMQAAARSDGHDLQLVSSYRSFERQCQIWNKKWQGLLPLNTLEGKTVDAKELSEQDKLHAILLWSALPGASRHHWGTDIDVYDKQKVDASGHVFQLVTGEYENNGPCSDLARWLAANIQRFGFFLPYAHYTGGVAREPWHLSYRAIADQIEKQYSLSALREQLIAAQIEGLDTILDQLDSIYTRYTLNQGIIAC